MAVKVVLTEKAFQAQVIQAARALGYRIYHTYDSRRSNPGWPDLVLWKKGRALFRELKSEKGRVTALQEMVLESLREAGLDVGVWRPGDWDTILAELGQKPEREKTT